MATQEFLSNVRYLLNGPSMVRPQAFFNRKAAEQRKERIEGATHDVVHLNVQHLVNGEWINVRPDWQLCGVG